MKPITSRLKTDLGVLRKKQPPPCLTTNRPPRRTMCRLFVVTGNTVLRVGADLERAGPGYPWQLGGMIWTVAAGAEAAKTLRVSLLAQLQSGLWWRYRAGSSGWVS